MRADTRLSELDLFVLLALQRLGDDAYGVAIRREIEQHGGRRAWIGPVYTSLDRLAQRGLLESWLTDPLPVRGGRARKHFRLTRAGERALHESLAMLDRMRGSVAVRAAHSVK
jgi:DNA-binding PadR family transcriptional regulator